MTTEIRDRDALWCRCLGATLDPREIAKVLGVFLSERPDKPEETTGERSFHPDDVIRDGDF